MPSINPEKIIEELVKVAKKIEYFVNKIPDKSLTGLFYSMVTLFFLCLLATLTILAIINLGRFFPQDYKWVIVSIVTIIIAGLLLYFINVATSKKNDDEEK